MNAEKIVHGTTVDQRLLSETNNSSNTKREGKTSVYKCDEETIMHI